MPIMYYLRDGSPPGNVTRSQDVSLKYVMDLFYGCKKRFLSPLSEGLPPLNPEMGPADRNRPASRPAFAGLCL